MPILYENYLNTLLEQNEWNTILKESNHNQSVHIGFHLRSYGGRVANNGRIQRAQQGLFDFFIYTTTRYEIMFNHKQPTHFNLLRDLRQNTTLEKCETVWRGDTLISNITNDLNEQAALTILSLMMFEQEVNYGDEIFQQSTNFSPANNYRPRDMLMGFVKMAFELDDISVYPYWDKGEVKDPRCYPDFNGSFRHLESDYKQHFEYYRDNPNGVIALLNHPASRQRLNTVSETSPNNPNYNLGSCAKTI